MLHKLGVKLTLINVLISGVILLAMAFAVFRVVENVMTTQYESDLKSFSSQMVSLAVSTVTEGGESTKIRVQMPKNYATFVIDEDHNLSSSEDLILSSGEALSDEAVSEIMPEVRALVSSEMSLGADAGISGEQRGLSLSYVRRQAASPSENVAFVATFSAFTAKTPYFFTIEGKPYRVSASMIGDGESERLLLVLQDRTEELTYRDRIRLMFLLSITGGLMLIVFASLFLSSRAIRPIEQSMRQQREFVAAASHELRTPVAAISANAEVLQDAELNDFAPYLNSIQLESDRMARLVSDLLLLARADAGELPVQMILLDAGEVAFEAIKLMAPLAEKNGVTLPNTYVAPAFMTGDPDRLKQVLVALLDNALRYAPEGSSVIVSSYVKGRHAIVSVSDAGPGIPDPHKERVFDRFYRLDAARTRHRGGAGLGLSVAAQCVSQMGGSIQVSDRGGGGCVFSMKFDSRSE